MENFTKICAVIVTILLMVAIVAAIGSCIAVQDPSTGEIVYGMKPETVAALDAAAETIEQGGPSAVTGITAISPAAGVVAAGVLSILGTLAATYRKWRTPLVTAKTRTRKLTEGARAAADFIDEIKKKSPELWKEHKSILADAERWGAINPNMVDRDDV